MLRLGGGWSRDDADAFARFAEAVVLQRIGVRGAFESVRVAEAATVLDRFRSRTHVEDGLREPDRSWQRVVQWMLENPQTRRPSPFRGS